VQPLLGERLAAILLQVIDARVASAEQALDEVRRRLGPQALALQNRLLLLFALREGSNRVGSMAADGLMSRELAGKTLDAIQRSWSRALGRPMVEMDRPGHDAITNVPMPAERLDDGEPLSAAPPHPEAKT
jgi:hypothetical protein